MVVGAFPIAKLSVLLIKQISKPIANICKENAKKSPFFRTYVCMPPAQFYNWCEVKAKMWILNLGKPVNIPVLSQEMAIELGANLLGESLIFVIGAGLLLVEYNRQSKKETAKEAKREEEMNHILTTITDLYFTVQEQQTKLREMERMILSTDNTKNPPTPPKGPLTPPKPTPPPPKSPQAVAKPQKVNYSPENNEKTSTPYPDQGVILKSLNYIQMDAFSSLFSNKSEKQIERQEETANKTVLYQKTHTALITAALSSIEYNFKSLF